VYLYKRLPSPLHAARAGAAVAWACALVVAALAVENPVVLAVLGGAILAAGFAAGVGRALLRALRPGLAMAAPIALVNVLVARQGLTVFARLGDLGPFGQGDLTVEALAYGGVIALKVGLLPLIATLAVLGVDPDELLGAVRRLSFRSAVTASLATRMLGVLGADAQRLAEARRTRPARVSRVALLSALVGSSLERALDVAATLELRGFALARRSARPRKPSSRHDLAFLASALGVVVLAVLARRPGIASFSAYPVLRCTVNGATLAVCAGLFVGVLAPFCDRRGVGP
jgi:energy-coupling factor transport system permease protein